MLARRECERMGESMAGKKHGDWRPEGNTFLVFQKGPEPTPPAPPGSASTHTSSESTLELAREEHIFLKESQLPQEQMVLWGSQGQERAPACKWGALGPCPTPALTTCVTVGKSLPALAQVLW